LRPRFFPRFAFSKPLSEGLIRDIAFESGYREPKAREIAWSLPKSLALLDNVKRAGSFDRELTGQPRPQKAEELHPREQGLKPSHGDRESLTGIQPKSIHEKVYETGRKCAAGFKKTMKILCDKVLPKWNYRAVPEPV
jgi:hypothetical protein